MVTLLAIVGAVGLVAAMVRYARRYSRGETISDTDDPYGWDNPNSPSND